MLDSGVSAVWDESKALESKAPGFAHAVSDAFYKSQSVTRTILKHAMRNSLSGASAAILKSATSSRISPCIGPGSLW